jgi:hypothetical protein
MMQSGETIWGDYLEAGESTGWQETNGEETWVWIQHPYGTPMGVYYEGTIEYYQSK